MPAPETHHGELVAGLTVKSGSRTGAFYTEKPRSGGTITGIATDLTTRRKVLVTNLHVMAGSAENGTFNIPAGTEQMLHPTVDPDGANLVGTRLDYYPWGTTNQIDIATCDVAPVSVSSRSSTVTRRTPTGR